MSEQQAKALKRSREELAAEISKLLARMDEILDGGKKKRDDATDAHS